MCLYLWKNYPEEEKIHDFVSDTDTVHFPNNKKSTSTCVMQNICTFVYVYIFETAKKSTFTYCYVIVHNYNIYDRILTNFCTWF